MESKFCWHKMVPFVKRIIISEDNNVTYNTGTAMFFIYIFRGGGSWVKAL